MIRKPMRTREQQLELMKQSRIPKKIFDRINDPEYIFYGDRVDLDFIFDMINDGNYDCAFSTYCYCDTIVRDEVMDILDELKK